MRILNENVFNQIILDHPLGQILESEELGVWHLFLLQDGLGVLITLLNFLEYFLKVSHPSNFLVKVGAHEVLLSHSKLIHLRDLIDICLWLTDFDVVFEGLDDFLRSTSLYFFDLI